MIERVILAGGGTGGHLFPGIAVYEELKRREPELETLFVGTARGLETKVVPQLGERLECLAVQPLKGRAPKQLAQSLWALPQAGLEAARLIRSFRPSLVLGMGGYAAGPLVATAALLGVPTAVMEQNAHVGLTNRMLARFVDRAYLSFDETASLFAAHKVRVVGNPVRRAFVSMGHMARMDPAAFEMRARKLLVIGGSQGARVLNQLVPEALARAGVAAKGVEIVHQTGHAMVDAVKARYAELGIKATVTPFIDDMARAYASAALVIGRAGATSLAEICAVGRPSILVPFPAAADDHQWHNARALETRGAALAFREGGLEAETLAQAVSRLLDDHAARRRMADAARAMGRPDAAAAVVDDLCGWLGCAASGQEHEPEEGDTRDGEPGDSAGEDPAIRRALTSFPPAAHEREAMARRRRRRRSLAWSQADRYYGTRAVAAALE
jgi:UDP-N-acetylglucosamine--N-acetylmuramyl-(pentapeptide) pyrophosphoryl-undecaprenol N-acetylglucosamine transferase